MQMSFFDFEEFNELRQRRKRHRERRRKKSRRKNLRRKRFTSCPLR